MHSICVIEHDNLVLYVDDRYPLWGGCKCPGISSPMIVRVRRY